MREWMVKLLGKELTKWDRLKVATGVVSDEDMLSKLINFYAEAKGISLTRPQLPPPPPPLQLSADSPSAAVRVRPMKEAEPPSAFIVIHQDDPLAVDDSFMNVEETPESPPPEHQFSFPMLMLREDADEQDDDDNIYEPEQEEDSDEEKPFHDIPIGHTRGVFYREPVRPTSNYRVSFPRNELIRLLDGMLWREAVLRGREMPLEDVRLVRGSDSRSQPMVPTLLPWTDASPDREDPPELLPLLSEFGCTLCDIMGFSSRVELMTHFWMNHPETRERHPSQYLNTKRDPYYAHCSLCTLTGAVDTAAKHNKLAPHVQSAHAACQRESELAPHVCDVCHVELASEAARDQHVAIEHAEHEVARYACVVCACVERGEQAYIRHLRVHYTEFMYSCNVCPNFRSRRPETMVAHTEKHERRTFRCGRCPFRTRNYRTLMGHIRIHLQLPSHICPVCGYRAYTSSRYFNHMDSHGGRTHRCEICSEEFTSLLKKSRHKTLVHRRPAKFTCDRCDITFGSSFKLRRHQASHTGYKPFRCPLCGKGLSSRQSLTNHTRICPENDENYPHSDIAQNIAQMVAS